MDKRFRYLQWIFEGQGRKDFNEIFEKYDKEAKMLLSHNISQVEYVYKQMCTFMKVACRWCQEMRVIIASVCYLKFANHSANSKQELVAE